MENYEIKGTYNYDMFKKLQGNRVVTEKRIEKIIESIQKVGYIMNPIIVNQNYEVIDGQGRLEALKRLKKPIYYVIVEGTGFQECVSMNINLTNWKIGDYLESYATQGNRSYIRLMDLMKKHNVSYKTACFALTSKSKLETGLIKEGALEFTDEEFDLADEKLNYLDTLDGIKKINGGITYFQQAVIFCSNHANVDKKRLKDKIEEGYSYMLPWRDTQTAVESIEAIYNRGLGVESKVFLGSDYKKLMIMNMGARGRSMRGKPANR